MFILPCESLNFVGIYICKLAVSAFAFPHWLRINLLFTLWPPNLCVWSTYKTPFLAFFVPPKIPSLAPLFARRIAKELPPPKLGNFALMDKLRSRERCAKCKIIRKGARRRHFFSGRFSSFFPQLLSSDHAECSLGKVNYRNCYANKGILTLKPRWFFFSCLTIYPK